MTESTAVPMSSIIPSFNAVQLNLTFWVDVRKALRNRSLEGCLYAADNGVGSKNEGSGQLVTNCKQGQTLNWIIYPLDSIKGSDGKWPVYPKINNIVFLAKNGVDVAPRRISDELAIIGGADKMRSPHSSVYYYWAATIRGDTVPMLYGYRLIIEIDPPGSQEKMYLNSESNLGLNVLPI